MTACSRYSLYRILLSLCSLASAQFVTKATPAHVADYNQLLANREGLLTNCDGSSTLFCGPGLGTCYTGVNNYIGCCSIPNCAIRTTCYNFDQVSLVHCDFNTGGCVLCTNSALPFCNYFTNVQDNQHAIYCGPTQTNVTVTYDNVVTTGSTAGFPAKTSATATSNGADSSTLNPGATATDPLASSTSSSSSEVVSRNNGGVSLSAIAGIVVGAIALGALTVAAIWYFRRRRRADTQPTPSRPFESPNSNENAYLYGNEEHIKIQEVPELGHELHEADDSGSWTIASTKKQRSGDQNPHKVFAAPSSEAKVELPAENVYRVMQNERTNINGETDSRQLGTPNPSTVSSTTTAVNTPTFNKSSQVSPYVLCSPTRPTADDEQKANALLGAGGEQPGPENQLGYSQQHGLGIGVHDSKRDLSLDPYPPPSNNTRPFSLSSTGWVEGERWVPPEEALLAGLHAQRRR